MIVFRALVSILLLMQTKMVELWEPNVLLCHIVGTVPLLSVRVLVYL
jgi:hypothetical protein